MAKVPNNRPTERAAVNKLRALLEAHGHMVQEVDRQNDFGVDLYLTFNEDGYFTGEMVKIQVKGGISYRRKNGYGVPVGKHADTWGNGNVPVLCVVHDPETDTLHWANATKKLRKARREREKLRTIPIDLDAKLDGQSIGGFVATTRRYLASHRGEQVFRAHLGEMCGIEFEPGDQVLHFVNEHGEDLIFWQRLDDNYATLLHSDLGFVPQRITPDTLYFAGGLSQLFEDREELPEWMWNFLATPTVGDVILNMAEAMWLASCFLATYWARAVADGPGQTSLDRHNETHSAILSKLVLMTGLLAQKNFGS